MSEREELEAEQNYAARQVRRFERREKYSLDPDNKRIAGVRRKQWENKSEKLQKELNDFDNNNPVKSVANSDESGIIKLQINLFDKSDPLWAEAFSIEEEDGFEDICIHGSPTSVQRIVNGSPKNYTAKEFAEYLKNCKEYNGGDIRLASCSTGEGDNSFAQQLSKELGIKVKAADDIVYYAPNEGTLFVGAPYQNRGKWRIFDNGVEIDD